MTTNVKDIESVIKAARWPDGSYDGFPGSRVSELIAKDLDAAGFVRPEIIETVEQLDALPSETTVLTEQGGIWFRAKNLTIYGNGAWSEPGSIAYRPSPDLTLPATVLNRPSA